MLIMIVGLILFFGAHTVPLLPIKNRLQANLGEKKYRGVIALPSLFGLVLIVVGYQQADISLLWSPVPYGRALAIHIMPAAFILLAGAHMKSNLKRFIKHPMLVGVLLWAILHLLNNGEVRAVILFSVFAIYAIVDMLLTTKKPTKVAVYPVKKDIILVVAGLVTYGVVLYLHGLAGVPLF